MVETNNLNTIISKTFHRFIHEKTWEYQKKSKANNDNLGFMLPSFNRSYMVPNFNEIEKENKLIGILIAHPEYSFTRNEILPHLGTFDEKSGEHIDFFCIGYKKQKNTEPIVAKDIDGINWSFDEEAFKHIVSKLESISSWKQSHSTELLLLNATAKFKEGKCSYNFNFKKSIVLNLEQMQNIKSFVNIREFFINDLFRYAKEIKKVEELSDILFAKNENHFIFEVFSNLIKIDLKNIQELFKKKYIYLLKDVS